MSKKVLEESVNGEGDRYRLKNAAQAIAAATRESNKVLKDMLQQAVREGLLSVYRPGSSIDRLPLPVRLFWDEAYWNDLNRWLETCLPHLDFRFPNPTAKSKTKEHPLAFFRAMDKFHFTKITFKVSDSGKKLIVSGYETNKPAAYSDLGLTLGDNMTLNVLGETFWEIAGGKFDYKNKVSRRRLVELTKALKNAFYTKDKPFKNGMPRYSITNPSKISAEKKARDNTTEFDDGFHAPTFQHPESNEIRNEEITSAVKFLKKHGLDVEKSSSEYPYSDED